MSNQIGGATALAPGDELICEAQCHIYKYEQGGYAQLSGVAAHTVEAPTACCNWSNSRA